ncbi:hypothetical protein OS493_034262 [Desmophyllum pertusum]|uniref:Uncharacterized protein n=1 Tax=Desmophyllum pertusum TaxID=174260 RepID=A0A9W9Z818_9CNID|nr:hypothetical protein OS493_034262 [Desmophyllum pertusum]
MVLTSSGNCTWLSTMIERNSAFLNDPMKKSFSAHHMYPMFNAGSLLSGIGTKIQHWDVPNEDRKKDSFIQNVELQRSLSFVSPRGFLFRLNKDERTLSQRQGNIKRARRIHEKTDAREFYTTKVGREQQDASSIIQNSILQRRNLALKSASKLKELRVDGANLLKADGTPQHERLDVFSPIDFKARKDRATILPLLTKRHKTLGDDSVQRRRKAMDFKAYSPLSINSNQILPRKPEVLEMKAFDNFPKKKHRTEENIKFESNVVHQENDGIISEGTQKRRTIDVFLPAITTDEEL